ncbi:MAG: hypothetical protein WD795_21715 [Woeseia sp.]
MRRGQLTVAVVSTRIIPDERDEPQYSIRGAGCLGFPGQGMAAEKQKQREPAGAEAAALYGFAQSPFDRQQT